MQLPKIVTQIGESNPHCKVYVEDYVISYMKQLNQYARDKSMAVGLYGVRKEEAGVTYLFFYGAGRLNFLQKECRHLSQAVLQEAEKQRKRYFQDYVFLGYRLLDGEMVEGFHICEQGVCRYIEGYEQFYEKNDSMLAYMIDQRQEEAKPEEFDQEKYNVVKKRQEERRAGAVEGGHASGNVLFKGRQSEKREVTAGEDGVTGANVAGAARLRRMKFSAAAVFVLLCVTGLTAMGNGENVGDWQSMASRFWEELTRRQLPDHGDNALEVSNGSVQVGTIVAEDKLNDAILKENASSGTSGQPSSDMAVQATTEPVTESGSEPVGEPTVEPIAAPTVEPVVEPTVAPTIEPTMAPTPEPTAPPTPQPVSYTVKRGDTLIGICIQKYGSDARVSEVCSLNNIANPDSIKVGQKILLP